MPTQVLRNHNLALHTLIHHPSFSVPALKSTHRYRFKPYVIVGSNIGQNVRFGNALHGSCGPRAEGEDGAYALAELLRGEVVENGGKGR